MSKHTTGPWSVAETRHGYDTVIRGPKGEPIALSLIGGYAKKEGGANSSLIAAAPDLLEALNWVIRNHYDAGVVGARANDLARAAIARATGDE